MSLKDILSPFYVWKRAFSKPFTTERPLSARPGAPRYRGFHQNDIDKCIGCGTCESICQNEAIDLMPVREPKPGDSGLRPLVDYGRCCWCALCVDICPTGSLSMSNEYVWVDTDPEVFRYIPGVDAKPWDNATLGYRREEDYRLLEPRRAPMPQLSAEEGVTSFAEMVRGYSHQLARAEADRCVECGLCVASCPAHMDIPQYIRAVREDRLEDALQILYRTNPLSNVCGRICTRRCEDACALGHLGDPVAIRWLKRYIVDQVPGGEYQRILAQEAPPTGKRVAIIGAGPGGLAAAYWLTCMGHGVVVFEAHEKPGGMLRYGVPEYRLPCDSLDRDIAALRALGVEIRCNTRVGEDIDFHTLYADYDAIFFSTGLDQPHGMRIPGEELPGVVSGLAVLADVTEGRDPHIGPRVAVVGGGNVAMDAARTARRLGCQVHLLYRRREEDMPADAEEIHEAKGEGVRFTTQAIPVRIEQTEDGLAFVWGEAEMVEQGPGKRPSPVLREDRIHTDVFDTVIAAIGQGGDIRFIPDDIAALLNIVHGKLKVDEHNYAGANKVFAGGDLVNDTADAVSAIADGHRAAVGIDEKLVNRRLMETLGTTEQFT